jgi:hypothetical protein
MPAFVKGSVLPPIPFKVRSDVFLFQHTLMSAIDYGSTCILLRVHRHVIERTHHHKQRCHHLLVSVSLHWLHCLSRFPRIERILAAMNLACLIHNCSWASILHVFVVDSGIGCTSHHC